MHAYNNPLYNIIAKQMATCISEGLSTQKQSGYELTPVVFKNPSCQTSDNID